MHTSAKPQRAVCFSICGTVHPLVLSVFRSACKKFSRQLVSTHQFTRGTLVAWQDLRRPSTPVTILSLFYQQAAGAVVQFLTGSTTVLNLSSHASAQLQSPTARRLQTAAPGRVSLHLRLDFAADLTFGTKEVLRWFPFTPALTLRSVFWFCQFGFLFGVFSSHPFGFGFWIFQASSLGVESSEPK